MRIAAQTYQAGFDAENDSLAGTLLRFYTGNVNPTRGVEPTGTVLTEMNTSAPVFNPSTWDEAQKKLTATKVQAALQDLSANAQGTVGCFAFMDGSLAVADGSVGAAGSGADCIVSSVDVSAGAPFVVDSLIRTRTIS